MSAAAIQLLNHLREGGVENERAVKIAEAFDLRVKEALEDAKAHADRNRAETEAQAKTQFVAADEYHARDKTLATRADLHENAVALRAEITGLRAEVRSEFRGLYLLLVGGFITLFVTFVGGFTAIIAKLFFGV